MSATHTPGQWVVLTPDRFGRQVQAPWAITEGAAYICIGPEWDECRAGECAANARLIASAPDLLAACRDLVSVLPDPDGMEDPDDVVRSRIIRARAAIAAAIGAQP